MDRGAWWATVHGVARSDTTEVSEQALSNDTCTLAVKQRTDAPHVRSREDLTHRHRRVAEADTCLPLTTLPSLDVCLEAVTEYPQARFLHP